jgi:competence protein ComEC
MALATWLSALAALHMPAPAVLTGAGSALAGTVLLCRRTWRTGRVGRRRAGAWAGVAVVVLLGVACGGVATAARLVARDAAPVAEPVQQRARASVELTVRRDPRPLRRTAGRPAGWLVPAWLHRLRTGGEEVRARVRVLVLADHPAWRPLLPGQRVRAAGRLAPPRGGDLTAAVLVATGPPVPCGDPPWVQRAAGGLRAGLQAAVAPLPDEPGGLLPGLAIGDVSGLDPVVTDDFRATGLAHLVAVSGTNIAIFVGFVIVVSRACRAPPWLTALLGGVALTGYVILCRPDPSVLRAGAMGLVGLLALATGRPRAAVPALGAAVIALVVLDPQLAGEAGFALSVVATGGLLLLAPRWRDGLRRRGVPAGVAEAVAVPAAAQVAVAPLIAGLSGTISPVAVVANLVATPAVAPATLVGVLAAVASAVSPALAALLAWLGGWPAWWLVLVARYGAQVPAAVLPWPAGTSGALLLAALTLAGLVALRHRRGRALVAVVAGSVVAGALPVLTVGGGWPPAGAVVVACAVGQGDLVVLPLGGSAAVVVDTGPEPAAADRCLRDLRVRSVPLLVVSHFHADHVGGIEGVLRGREVAAVLVPAMSEPEFGHDLVATAVAGGVPVAVGRPGTTYHVGAVTLTVLGPPYPMRGTRSDANNNSLVLMAHVGGVRVLLAGDAEVELQQALMERLGADRLRADVLKVPHHGSSYQDEAFLDAVDPTVALVPVGRDNDYGHPHPPLLAELVRDGARVLRTDVDGDLAVVQHDGALAVVTRAPPLRARPLCSTRCSGQARVESRRLA